MSFYKKTPFLEIIETPGERSCHFGSLLKTRECKIGEYVIESTGPSSTSDELTTQSTQLTQ